MRHADISRYDRTHHPLIAYRDRFRHDMLSWWCGDKHNDMRLLWQTAPCRFHNAGSFLVAQFILGEREPLETILSFLDFRAKLHVFGTRASCVIARKGLTCLWTQWNAWADASSYIAFMIGGGFARREDTKRVPFYMNRLQHENRYRKPPSGVREAY